MIGSCMMKSNKKNIQTHKMEGELPLTLTDLFANISVFDIPFSMIHVLLFF